MHLVRGEVFQQERARGRGSAAACS